MGNIILYAPDDTILLDASKSEYEMYTGLGFGILSDAVNCEVTEVLNGQYELVLDYPVNGIHYEEIQLRSLIACNVGYKDRMKQVFRVYQIDKPINGLVSIYARHISYDLSGYPVKPFASYNGINEALQMLLENSQVECPFVFETDIRGNSETTFAVDQPSSIRSWMGGRTGALTDVFGGEWDFDNYRCMLLSQRGSDRGVTIRYGKNLKNINWQDSEEGHYTGIWGFYSYIHERKHEQEDSEPRCLGSMVKAVTEYYAAGASDTTPPALSEFVSKDEWDGDSTKKVSITKDLPYLWNYEVVEYENGGTDTTTRQVIGHYGAVGDADVEYDDFGNSLVPYEHTARSTARELYQLSASSATCPADLDEDGKDAWKTSVPSPTAEKPYLWNRSITVREAKKERIIFSDVVPTGNYDYTKILTVDLSDQFEAPPTKAALNSFIRGYIAEHKLGHNQVNLSLDFVQLEDVKEYIELGDTIHVIFEDTSRSVRCTKVTWDVIKERFTALEVGDSVYTSMSSSITDLSAKSNPGGKYGDSSILAFLQDGYIKAEEVDTKVLRAEEAYIGYLQANYASIDHLETNYLNAQKIAAAYATISNLNAANAQIENLKADTAKIHDLTADQLTASVGYIEDLTSKNITTENLAATTGYINVLTSEHITAQDLIAETAKIHSLTAQELGAAVGYINTLGANEITTESLIADHAAVSALGSNYAAIDFANVATIDISDAWIKNLMIQGGMVAQNGAYFDLTGLRINANDIQTGTMTADHLQIRGTDGLYYVLNYDVLGQARWEALTQEEQAALQQHIHAETILAHSITSDQLTVNNISGTGGWINLANGTFEYENALTGNGISWDGQHLNINADSLSIGSRSVEEVIADSSVINRMPSVYLIEDWYGKIFDDEENGIVWTVNQDGSVTANGTAKGIARYMFTSCLTDDDVPVMMLDPDQKYTISGCPEGNGSSPDYWIGGRLWADDQTPATTGGTVFSETGRGYTSSGGHKYITIYAQIRDGYTIPEGGITFYPMLETGETVHNYVSTHDGTGAIVDRIGVAEAKIEVNSDNIEAKVSKDGLIAEINLQAGEALINAQAIDLSGAVKITDFDSTAKSALVSGVASKNQYYLSTSDSAPAGGTWYDNMSSINFSGDLSNRYLFTRVQVTRTFADGTTGISNSTPVRDDSFKTNYLYVQQVDNAASAAASAASSAAATANKAIASQISVYYRSTSSSTPSKPTTSTSIGSAEDTDNAWEYIMPAPKYGRYFWTCEKYTYKDGTIGFSAVRKISQLNYTSMWCSSSNATYIDGSHIATGTITANQIAANTITANKIKAGAITADMITAGTMSGDRIKGGVIDCNGSFTFRLPSTISDEQDWDILKLSGTNEANARIDMRPAYFYYNGANIHAGLFHLANSFGNANEVSATNVSGQSGRWERNGNMVIAKITATASAAFTEGRQILSGFPVPYYLSGSNWTLPRGIGMANDGSLCQIYINTSGYAVMRSYAAGKTYYADLAYITTDS